MKAIALPFLSHDSLSSRAAGFDVHVTPFCINARLGDFGRVADVLEIDESLDPVTVGLRSADTVMPGSNDLRDPVARSGNPLAGELPNGDRRLARELFMTPTLPATLSLAIGIGSFDCYIICESREKYRSRRRLFLSSGVDEI
jgi:hypothetical protein